MHILLTRPLEDCSDMIIKFKSLGHQVSHLPLLNIDKVNYDKINFLEYTGIIFTSANSVKFLDLSKIDKKIQCFCVGNATEKKARSSGFQNVIAAEGNVSNLKELVLQNFNKNDEFYYWFRKKKEAQIIIKHKGEDKGIDYITTEFEKIEKPNLKMIFDMANVYKN